MGAYGFYGFMLGSHGNEYVLIHYTTTGLVGTKITGDVNVPRGEQSISCSLINPKPYLGPTRNTELDIRKSSEFPGAVVYEGYGTVAMEGYQNPMNIACDGIFLTYVVIVCSEEVMCIYWHGLDDMHGMGWISKFIYCSDIQ